MCGEKRKMLLPHFAKVGKKNGKYCHLPFKNYELLTKMGLFLHILFCLPLALVG